MNNVKKTKEMDVYEQKTGKKAIWHGKITNGFLKWKQGEKDYYADKKRISVYVSTEIEKNWQNFLNSHNYSSFSKLIRESVNFFIKEKTIFGADLIYDSEITGKAKLVHLLKEKLTTIKGFIQLILENYRADINNDIISILNDVLDESEQLEKKIIDKLENRLLTPTPCDVLLIEDDPSTVNLLKNYFESKNYSFKSAMTGIQGIDELNLITPRLILLDIILPDISGYNICKDIKSHEKYKSIPVFYLTAVPSFKVKEKMEETKADGFILKPFDFKNLKFLFDYL